jgi:hypothetical protein
MAATLIQLLSSNMYILQSWAYSLGALPAVVTHAL